MKILLVGKFWPSVGGVEVLQEIFANEFLRKGHQVSVVTDVNSSAQDIKCFEFPVYRSPSLFHFVFLCRQHDVILLSGLSLKAYFPALLSFRAIWIRYPVYFSKENWRGRLKAWIADLHHCRGIANSRFTAKQISPRLQVIGEPFDSKVFLTGADYNCARRKSRFGIIFVGRLISCKGCDILFEALSLLPCCAPPVSIVGDGPERLSLQCLASKLGLRAKFYGKLSPQAVSLLARRHDIFVIPSRWAEPFGLVTLEALASGCRTIVSDSCGLEEASGGFAATFKRGSSHDLARVLLRLLNDLNSFRFDQTQGSLHRHLMQHSPSAVVSRYEKCMLADALSNGCGQ